MNAGNVCAVHLFKHQAAVLQIIKMGGHAKLIHRPI